MTAILLSAPPLVRRRAPRVGHARVEHARVRRYKATTPIRTARPAPGRVGAARGPLRLTRRGRLVITGALASAGVAATLFTGSVSLAGTQVEHQPVRYLTVAPGDTLWAIAGDVAPGADRRDTVQRLRDLNALESSELRAGQRIAVPARR